MKREREDFLEKNGQFVYFAWVCLKGMVKENTIKKKSSKINHFNDSYN